MKLNLMPSLQMLLGLSTIFGIYKVITLIMLLFSGVTAEVALGGSIAVPTSINSTIDSTVTSINAGYTLINAGDTIVLGLIGLVVILTLFWPLIEGYIKTKKSGKGKKSSGGFM